MIWYFSGMRVFVNSAALPVPFPGDSNRGVSEVVVVVVISLLFHVGWILLVNNDTVIESIEIHHNFQINLKNWYFQNRKCLTVLWIKGEIKTREGELNYCNKDEAGSYQYWFMFPQINQIYLTGRRMRKEKKKKNIL